MTQLSRNSKLADSAGIVSKDLILEDEYKLPKAFSKVLLRRFLDNPTVRGLNNNEFVSAYMSRLDNFTYIFIIIRMGDDALMGSGAPLEDLGPNADALRDRIFHFFHSVISEEYPCFPISIDRFLAFVIELEEGASSPDTAIHDKILKMEKFLLEAQRKMHESFGFISQLIISDIKHDLGDMPVLFQQTLFTIDYVFDIYPGRDVITFLTVLENIPDTSDLGPKPEFERLYFDCIADYDFNMANTILQQRIYEETLHPSTALSVRLRIHTRMAWTLSFLGLPMNRGLSECVAIYDCVDRVITCKTIDRVYDCVEDFFRRLGIYYRQSSMVIADKIDMISDYIKENYSDHTLSVGKICEIFNVSPAHLSRVFKKKTGLKLIDFIHIARLAQAKILLETTSRKLSDIAGEVGYSGEWTLIRAFKRYEGATPGSLRSDIKNT